MRGTLTIACREFAGFFRVPLGWLLASLFLLLSGAVFARSVLVPGEPASLREFFGLWWGLLVVVAPAISMRLIAEELRTGTIEPLTTSPLAELSIALGKFLGAYAFLLVCLAMTFAYPLVLLLISRPDPGPMVAGYLGVALLGALYLAIGLLLSSLTSSQTLAFLGTLFILLAAEIIAQQVASKLPAPFDTALASLSISRRVSDFARGLVDTGHTIFFIATSAWCIGATALVLKARRWR